jgi:predicted nucleic acid-binding protein
VAVIVFDADVLIAYLSRDAHHAEAVRHMRDALEPGTRRLVSAVNYTELLIGPSQAAGTSGAQTVDDMFARLGIETIPVDMALARTPATVRARTRLKLPDAYALASAIHA